MANYTDFFNKCCGKEYIAETNEYKFRGILLNYNSGNVVLYNENDETICHIPYRDLRVLRPVKPIIKKKNENER